MAKRKFEVLGEKCAFDADKRVCSALNVKKCEGCRFRKTEEELIRGKERAAARIKTLSKEYQAHIKSKYYSYREQRY